MIRDDLSYDPAVIVTSVYRVSCHGGCGWQQAYDDKTEADRVAIEHELWHHKTIETLESDGRCRNCGIRDSAPRLAEGKHGGLPFLYCGTCGADW